MKTSIGSKLGASAPSIACTALVLLGGCARSEELESSATLGRSAQALTVSQIRDVLGFEKAADWQASRGSLASSTDRVLGNRSLRWSGGGYAVVQSVPIGPVGSLPSALTFRLKLPSPQPNSHWYGQVMVALSAPSKGVNNQNIGAVELTGKPLGQFLTISLDIPSSLRSKLVGSYSDLRVSVILNVPNDSFGPYLFDDLRLFAATAPPPPIPSPTTEEILDFDASASWSGTTGTTLSFVAEPSASNARALRLTTPNAGEITSLPLDSVESFGGNPFDRLDIRVRGSSSNPPSGAPRSMTVSLVAGALGPSPRTVGVVSLDALSPNAFRTFQLPIPLPILSALRAAAHDDLRMKLRFSSSAGSGSTYWLDRAAIGSANRGKLFEEVAPGSDEDTPLLVADDISTPPSLKFPGKPRGPEEEIAN